MLFDGEGSYPRNPVHDVGHVRVVHLAYQQPEHFDFKHLLKDLANY